MTINVKQRASPSTWESNIVYLALHLYYDYSQVIKLFVGVPVINLGQISMTTIYLYLDATAMFHFYVQNDLFDPIYSLFSSLSRYH